MTACWGSGFQGGVGGMRAGCRNDRVRGGEGGFEGGVQGGGCGGCHAAAVVHDVDCAVDGGELPGGGALPRAGDGLPWLLRACAKKLLL